MLNLIRIVQLNIFNIGSIQVNKGTKIRPDKNSTVEYWTPVERENYWATFGPLYFTNKNYVIFPIQ